MIAAHNEEAVIEDLLESLQTQNYPRELYDIFIVADNCTDRTAQLVRDAGFQVFERFNKEKKGKTWAIKDLLVYIEETLGIAWWEEYQGMAMFDADNVVDAEFFHQMNNHFELHPNVKAVQGYADTKNPNDNHLTEVYALAYWSASRFWQLPRFRSGLSCALAGTGFVLETKTLRRMGWNPKSMVEDLELSAQLVLEGERVHWNEWAIIYDEKPLDVKISYRQRERWIRGHWWCFLTYSPDLLRAVLKHRQLRDLDMLLYLFAPAQTLLNFFLGFFGYVWTFWLAFEFFLGEGHFHGWHIMLLIWPLLTLVQHLSLVLMAPLLYRRTHPTRPKQGFFRYIQTLPMLWFYFLMWVPITLQAMWRVKDQGSWVRTPHTQRVVKAGV